MVALAGDSTSPTVIDRRRIVLADPKLEVSKQPYHAAEGLPLSDAEKLVDRCRASTLHLAEGALATALDDLKKRDAYVVGCGLLMSSGRNVTELATILSSHALIHSAEGDFFRNAITHAAGNSGLTVTGVREKQAYERAAAELNTNADALLRILGSMGKALGCPWTQDEKLATLAAWLVLASGSRRKSNSSVRSRVRASATC